MNEMPALFDAYQATISPEDQGNQEAFDQLKLLYNDLLIEQVSGIASSSEEQSLAIGQIGSAIDQVSQVVSQNSATAEESASASHRMSGQAALLQQLIAQFKIKDGGGYRSAIPAPQTPTAQLPAPTEFGKY